MNFSLLLSPIAQHNKISNRSGGAPAAHHPKRSLSINMFESLKGACQECNHEFFRALSQFFSITYCQQSSNYISLDEKFKRHLHSYLDGWKQRRSRFIFTPICHSSCEPLQNITLLRFQRGNHS
jgi:hypothetical protein